MSDDRIAGQIKALTEDVPQGCIGTIMIWVKKCGICLRVGRLDSTNRTEAREECIRHGWRETPDRGWICPRCKGKA